MKLTTMSMVQSVKFKRVGAGYHLEEVRELRRLGVHALEALTGYHKELRLQSKLAWAGKPSTVPEEPQLEVEILQLRSSHLHSCDDGFDTAEVNQFRRDVVAGIVWWQQSCAEVKRRLLVLRHNPPSPLRRRLDHAVGVLVVAGVLAAAVFGVRAVVSGGGADPESFTAAAPAAEVSGASTGAGSASGGATASQGGSSQDASDGSMAAALAAAGVSPSMMDQVGHLADSTGYGLSKSTPLSLAGRQDFAFVTLMVCRDVDQGTLTWPAVVSRDIADGADPADAAEMNSYLEHVYCPQVDYEAALF